MRAMHAPGRPVYSMAPRKPPRKIAPAKLAAKFCAEVAKQREDIKQAKKRRAFSAAVTEHLEALAEAQRKKKARPSALDPVLTGSTPMQETKGKPTTKNKLVRLLKLSALAIMSHPFGAQLASWTTGPKRPSTWQWLGARIQRR
jgi:hypothetical protein